jgi:hypothetical protein
MECGEGTETDVLELVEQAAFVTPRLRRLVFTYEEYNRWDYVSHFSLFGSPTVPFRMNSHYAARLAEECFAKGIELEVFYN